MKPTFALDLSQDFIALLHRTPKGWMTIGEVAFDAPDLDSALDYLRKTALGLSPLGLACKVIIPNSQVLYTEVHAPGPSREDKRRQIAEALQGRTPYPVEDLVFDWSGKGTMVRVAVVARETLDEAEAFALGHRLNPVSFVTVPDDSAFIGEAWFGATNSADTFLAPGEEVERDREPVTILRRDPGSLAYETAVEAVAAEGILPLVEAPPTASEADPVVAPTAAKPVPDIEPGVRPADAVVPADEATDAPVWSASDVLSDFAPAVQDTTGPAQRSDAAEPAITPSAITPSVITPSVITPTAEAEEAPFAEIPDEAESEQPAKPAALPGAARVLASDILDDDIPPAPSAAAMLAFSSRRSAATVAAGRPNGRVPPPVTANRPAEAPPSPPPAATTAPKAAAPAPQTARARPVEGSVTAPTIQGLRNPPKPKILGGEIPRPVMPAPRTVLPAPRTVKTNPRGTFDFPAAVPKRSRSGFVFMMLIGLLLLCLALVAAWASFFLTQATDEAVDPFPTASIEVPAVEDEMAADLQDPEEFADPEATAVETTGEDTAAIDPAEADLDALAVEEMPVNIGGDDTGLAPAGSVAEALAAAPAETEPAAEATEADESAPASAIATDVTGARTPVEDQDEIFLAAMDAPPPILDALALPAPAETADALPALPGPPPAFGTVYQFDAAGLLMPTAEGILTPEGIMLYAGAPPLVPPARSPVAEAAALAAAPLAPVLPETAATDPATTAADASLVATDAPADARVDPLTDAALDAALAEAAAPPSPADPALAGFRPKPRPATLIVPADDGASLDAGAISEFADVRPLARPASVAALASAAAPATPDEAVADLGAQGASLTAQAEARLAASLALEAENPSIVAISLRPMPRPSDLSRAVEAAVAAAVREPDATPEAEVELAAANPDEVDEMSEPDSGNSSPSIPTKASVAKQATYENAINLSKINLIGTFGPTSEPYALIRQANGRYKKVEVGDKIDGGVVKAITADEVRYLKGGKLITLQMPNA